MWVAGTATLEIENVAREVTVTGNLVWMNLEGGVYALETEEGTTYDLHEVEGRLPPEVARPDLPGVPVRVRGFLYEEVADIHMVGPVLHVEELELLWED